MDGFVVLELILVFSAFVTCNFNVEGSEKLEFPALTKLYSMQNSAKFLPSTSLTVTTHSTIPPPTENTIITTHTSKNFTHHTNSTILTSTAAGNTTQHNHSIGTTSPAANTTSGYTTGNTTQHNHSIATTTQAATTTSGYTTGNTTQRNHSITTTTPAANTTSGYTTGNTTQRNHSITTTAPAANTTSSYTTGNTTQHNHSIGTTTPAANTTSVYTTGNTTKHNHSIGTTTTAANTTSSYTTDNTTQHNHSIATTTPAANITVLTTGETVGPTLSPKPSPPPVLNYSVTWPNSSTNCIQASMALELIVQNSDKMKLYFNIERDGTISSGTCGEDQSNLNITFNKGFIRLTFKKVEDSYFISEIEARLKVPSQGTVYNGGKRNQQLFKTRLGYSFKCVNKQTVTMADNFQLRTINTQLQAFNIDHNNFGKVSECSADYHTVALALGLTVVIVVVLALIIYGIYLKCKSNGYQRI